MDINKNANLSMLCDYYELTMGNGYFVQGMQDRITYFDIFFRSVPDNGGFAIAAGLEQAIEYVQQLHFDEDDIAYLRSRNMFDEGFLSYLRDFRFTGDIWAVPEGTPIFPREPIMTVRAPAIQAQLVETFLLLTLNHPSLIATKANRVVRAAKGRTAIKTKPKRGTKAVKAEADRLFSLIVRAEGKCQMCGWRCPCPEFPRKHTTGCRLQCSHFVGRTANWTRTYELNALCLCASDHARVEGNPPYHVDVFIGLRGAHAASECQIRGERTSLTKFDWPTELIRLRKRAVELGILPGEGS